jgi:hypothetical protein
MQKRVIFGAILSAAAVALSLAACAAPTPPTVAPLVFTQTAAAEQTSDAVSEAARLTAQALLNQPLIPTETPSPAPTRTARPTETSTPRIVLSPTPTASPLPSPTATDTPSPYQCRIIEQSPGDGTTVDIDALVNVRWKIRNVGSAMWESIAIDFLQTSGDQVAVETLFDLPRDVKPGEDVEFKVVLETTDRTGIYRTDWRLVFVEGGFTFCPVYIEVWATDLEDGDTDE